MRSFSRGVRLATLGLCVLVSACGALVPPESCGPGTDGPPDEVRYAEAFRFMELVHAASGAVGEPDEEGNPGFTVGEDLQILTDNLRPVNVRACVQERRSSGRIAAEREGVLPAGRAVIPLGSFEEGDYIARLMVDRVLVRNLPFSVREADD